MEIKKYFRFLSSEDNEDKISEQSELAKELLITLEMFIDIIDDNDDVKKLEEIEEILKKYK